MNDSSLASKQHYGDAPYFIFVDHASNHIPADLNKLGLPDDLLETHIAWDIGAETLAQNLGERLAGTVFSCNFSRLIIDPNRDLIAVDSIPATSDQIPIPGNQMLSDEERQSRVDRFHVPYHELLNAEISAIADSTPAPLIVSVHTFTKRMMGALTDRPWDVGLLWRDDEPSAMAMIAWLNANSDWVVGDNEPYDARVFNYSIDRHVGPRGLRHLTLEVRQDKLCTSSEVDHTAALLAAAIEHTARSGG